LHEERAKSWTLGVDISPQSLPDLSLAATYFNIDFTDRIREPVYDADLLTNPQFERLLMRDFTAAERADACGRNFLGSADACLNAPISAIADLRLRNDLAMHTEGIDLLAKYSRATSFGTISFGLNSSYVLRFQVRQSPDEPVIELVSTQRNPVDLRFRASGGLTYRGFDLHAFLNFMNNYRDTTSVPNRRVSSWTTGDLSVVYTTDRLFGSGNGTTQFSLAVVNVQDRDPPFLNNALARLGYDQENADLTGRIISFTVRKRW
jgi:outer membrane receptor protein involved in Fe transport